MKLTEFLEKLTSQPELIEFSDTMDVIEEYYYFTPAEFTNGDLVNEENENNGSCKIFSFGILNSLSEEHTLACFGQYYREDVVQHPEATDHQNIRNFMVSGWDGIHFHSAALLAK